VEEAHPDREDRVEAPVSQVQALEFGDEELGDAGLDVRGVPAVRGLDHVRGPVHRGQPAAVEPLAHERRRDALPASDLQHPVIGPDVQLLDDRAQPLAHAGDPAGSRPRYDRSLASSANELVARGPA
jgi:hypothetical protein